jgi:SAM-dependent methyltransferase
VSSHRSRARLAVSLVGRYVDAVVPLPTTAQAARRLPAVLRDRGRYQRLSGGELALEDDYPQLMDHTTGSPFDPHYTYQDAWAARQVRRHAPAEHIDVGSRITFVLGLAAWVPTTFIDLRPLDVHVDGLESRAGSLLTMPYADATVSSLSSLHVIEHVGLGRYGDDLDPSGTARAAQELARVLAPGGQLLIGVPVGRPRTAFNAHRVLHPEAVVELFAPLTLAGFSGVDDEGRFHESLEPADLVGATWGCGLYRFTRTPGS